MKYKDEYVAINKVATEENRTLHDGNQKGLLPPERLRNERYLRHNKTKNPDPP